jgi:hypothetical protein
MYPNYIKGHNLVNLHVMFRYQGADYAEHHYQKHSEASYAYNMAKIKPSDSIKGSKM